MAQDLSWLEKAGLDTKTGIDYTGGENKYISAILRFYSNYEKNNDKVTSFLASKDYESYMIAVHALKSNSRMIGALDLSNAFEALEMAARDGDTDYIDRKNDETMSSYK